MTERALVPAVGEHVRRLRPADLLIAVVDPGDPAALAHARTAIQIGLAQHFPTLRTVVLTVATAVADEPAVAIATAPADAVERALFVRPAHDVTLLDLRLPAAVRRSDVVLEVAGAVDAAATILIGGDLRYATPDWVELLAGPILKQRLDVVVGRATRHRFDDVIGSVFTAQVVVSLFGRRVREPGGGTVAVGRSVVAGLLASPNAIDAPTVGLGVTVVESPALAITVGGLAAATRVGEAYLGMGASDPRTRSLDPLTAAEATGSGVLALAAAYDVGWLDARTVEDVPAYGFRRPGEPPSVRVDPVAWLRTFEEAAPAMREAWSRILTAPNRNAVLGLAVTAAGVGLSARDWLNLDRGADIARLDTPTLAAAMATFQFPDDVWARVVADFLIAGGRSQAGHATLATALAPILLARAASFVVEARRASAADVDGLLARQSAAFERIRPDLVARGRSEPAQRTREELATSQSGPAGNSGPSG